MPLAKQLKLQLYSMTHADDTTSGLKAPAFQNVFRGFALEINQFEMFFFVFAMIVSGTDQVKS